MKALIVYDSQFGNTEKVAQAMGAAVPGEVKVLRAADASPSDVAGLDVLVIGTPTQGFRPTAPVQTFINGLNTAKLQGVKVAVFDTRFKADEAGWFLRLVMKGGYAAPRMAKDISKRGGTLAVPPEGFFVKDKEGPLAEGELARAGEWVRSVANG